MIQYNQDKEKKGGDKMEEKMISEFRLLLELILQLLQRGDTELVIDTVKNELEKLNNKK